MTAIRILTPSLLAIALVSCASHRAREYDTPNAQASPAQAGPSATAPANPVYDTPAAYEESAATAAGAAAPAPATAATATSVAPSTAPAPAASSNGAATIYTVVKGDTLSGISKKFKTPVASIKQANRMTNDIVVLGRKMVIPPQ